MKHFFFTVAATLALLAAPTAQAGRCAPHNSTDRAAIDVCNTQYSNKAGCQAQGYFCYWIDGGSCAANNPHDQAAVAVCNSQNSSQAGCRSQGYFCHWVP